MRPFMHRAPRRVLRVAALAACLSCSPGLAASSRQMRTPSDAQLAREASGDCYTAIARKDARRLELLLGDALTFVYANGEVDTKPQLLEAVRTGRFAYDSIVAIEDRVREYGGVVVFTGHAAAYPRSGVARGSYTRLRYTEVYARHEGRWQLVAWQGTDMR